MPELEDLSAYIDALHVPDQLDRDWLLGRFLSPLGVAEDDALADTCEDLLLAESRQGEITLQMRPGGWRINLTASLAKTMLAGSFVAAALAITGNDDIPAELIPAVLPLFMDVEKVRLDRRDRALLVPLRLAAMGREGISLNPQILYDRLDPTVRDDLNFGDFLSFCDRLIEAGQMDSAGYDEVRARPADDPAWLRITWS